MDRENIMEEEELNLNGVVDIEDLAAKDAIIYPDEKVEEKIVNAMDEPLFKVTGAYISSDKRDAILGSAIISLEDVQVILTSDHSFSVNDALQFVDTFTKSTVCLRIYKLNDRVLDIYYKLVDFCEDYRPRPDVVCFDPDYPKSWESCKLNCFHFHEPVMVYNRCGECLPGTPVFELYSISINVLDPKRDFSLIYMKSKATDMNPFIIYKRPEGKALPLKIPLLPPTANKGVLISFNNKAIESVESWWHAYYSRREDGGRCTCRPDRCNCKHYPIIIQQCKDRYNRSLATISYRIIPSAAWAMLTFIIFEEENRNIYVKYGVITATDGKDFRTERIIRQYPKGEAPVCLPSGKKLEVYRSVFGVPKSTYLRVKVELTYFVEGSPDEEKKIQGSLDFLRPARSAVKLHALSASPPCSTSLCVRTYWRNPVQVVRTYCRDFC